MRILGIGLGLLGLLFAVVIVVYIAFGIDRKAPSLPAGTGTTSPGSPAARPGYVGSMLDAKDVVQVQANLVAVQQRVVAHEALNGAFPASLDDLVKASGQPLPALPPGRAWTYDAATGRVDVK